MSTNYRCNTSNPELTSGAWGILQVAGIAEAQVSDLGARDQRGGREAGGRGRWYAGKRGGGDQGAGASGRMGCVPVPDANRQGITPGAGAGRLADGGLSYINNGYGPMQDAFPVTCQETAGARGRGGAISVGWEPSVLEAILRTAASTRGSCKAGTAYRHKGISSVRVSVWSRCEVCMCTEAPCLTMCAPFPCPVLQRHIRKYGAIMSVRFRQSVCDGIPFRLTVLRGACKVLSLLALGGPRSAALPVHATGNASAVCTSVSMQCGGHLDLVLASGHYLAAFWTRRQSALKLPNSLRHFLTNAAQHCLHPDMRTRTTLHAHRRMHAYCAHMHKGAYESPHPLQKRHPQNPHSLTCHAAPRLLPA